MSSIAYISALKPVGEPRSFQKIGRGLAGRHRVHLIGYANNALPPAPENIFFHPIFDFHRLSAGRLGQQKRLVPLLRAIKPGLVICGAFELLPILAALKPFLKYRLVYDVQEDYFQNILYQDNYPKWVKKPLAFAARACEHFSSLSIDGFLLAERSYENSLGFLRAPYQIVENKYSGGIPAREKKEKGFDLAYTGTITRAYGVLEGLRFAKKLNEKEPSVRLAVLGYCSDPVLEVEIKSEAEGCGFISADIRSAFVPNGEILSLLARSDFALLPYLKNKSTEHCLPTKMFECSALQTPMLFPAGNPLWENFVSEKKAGLAVGFENADIEKMLLLMRESVFYPSGAPGDVFWESEEAKLFDLIGRLL